MQKYNAVLVVFASLAAAIACDRVAVGQGFGDYVAPQTNAPVAAGAPGSNAGITVQSVESARQAGIATVRPSAQTQPAQTQRTTAPVGTTTQINNMSAVAQQPVGPQPTGPQVQIPANSTSQSAEASAPQGGYVASENVSSAILPPPPDYKPTEEEQAKLDEFLKKWEEFGKGIKRISCDVHMCEYDDVLQQQDKSRPIVHTWGQFRYISPNKLMYHIRGEFVYTAGKEKPEWKESQNEWKIVLNSKELVQYDYKNKKVVVYPIVDEEQDMDLTMDNGQFPLFFVAKANVLKSRFYMQIVTPPKYQKNQVWIMAFPRYARDSQQFQSITVILDLKNLQPSHMRKIGVNGKSKTDLAFENVAVNKGLWTIEGSVEPGWTKDVREEKFSIMRQAPIEPEQLNAQPQLSTAVANQNAQPRQAANANVAQRAVNPGATPTNAQRVAPNAAPASTAVRPATNAPRF
ncbi:MAG: hypothetical protein IJU03_05770 [Thermoguttaceae bacterium]|nr:hypothetical protein [Thermoguttaceae bacterium]